MTQQDNVLQIVGPKDQFPEVTLIDPVPSGYLLLAIEVDHRPPVGFFIPSGRKKYLLDRKKRPEVEVARFDVVMLVEFESIEQAQDYRDTPEWAALLADIEEKSHSVVSIAASNTRRIGPVDHDANGVFLFNYFYADSLDLNLKVWNYTAGWFQDQTGLDNSTVLLPQDTADVPYTIINHCRWDRLRDILPALLFNRSFRPFVLDNFEQNNTAAMPILYQLA